MPEARDDKPKTPKTPKAAIGIGVADLDRISRDIIELLAAAVADGVNAYKDNGRAGQFVPELSRVNEKYNLVTQLFNSLDKKLGKDTELWGKAQREISSRAAALAGNNTTGISSFEATLKQMRNEGRDLSFIRDLAQQNMSFRRNAGFEDREELEKEWDDKFRDNPNETRDKLNNDIVKTRFERDKNRLEYELLLKTKQDSEPQHWTPDKEYSLLRVGAAWRNSNSELNNLTLVQDQVAVKYRERIPAFQQEAINYVESMVTREGARIKQDYDMGKIINANADIKEKIHFEQEHNDKVNDLKRARANLLDRIARGAAEGAVIKLPTILPFASAASDTSKTPGEISFVRDGKHDILVDKLDESLIFLRRIDNNIRHFAIFTD